MCNVILSYLCPIRTSPHSTSIGVCQGSWRAAEFCIRVLWIENRDHVQTRPAGKPSPQLTFCYLISFKEKIHYQVSFFGGDIPTSWIAVPKMALSSKCLSSLKNKRNEFIEKYFLCAYVVQGDFLWVVHSQRITQILRRLGVMWK